MSALDFKATTHIKNNMDQPKDTKDNSQQFFTTATGLRVRKYKGFEINDLTINVGENFARRHNKVYESLISRNESVALEQEVIDRVVAAVEYVRNTMSPDDAAVAIKHIKDIRNAYLKKMIPLFDAIEKK